MPDKPRRAKGTGSISPQGREVRRRDKAARLGRCDRPPPHHENTEADRWLARIKYEHERDILPAKCADRITFEEFLNAWLEDSVKGTITDHTYLAYESKIRIHLIPVPSTSREMGGVARPG